jgi:hypothetical protein
MTRRRLVVPPAVALVAMLCTGPDRDVAGVETTNGTTVTARIRGTSLSLEAPCGCTAGLFDTAYSPFDTLPRFADSASSEGCAEAEFRDAPAGGYNAIVWCPAGVALLPELTLETGARRTTAAELGEPGRIEVPLRSNDTIILVHLRGTPLGTVARDGRAVLDGVPAGDHRLHSQAGSAGSSIYDPFLPGSGAEPTITGLSLEPGERVVVDTVIVRN